jgi:hypothetical protein
MNIILDMDQTLLDGIYFNQHFSYVTQRPFLKKFFIYIFSKFKNVSIWTHATSEWYNFCYNKILKYAIPKGKQFSVVITRDNGTLPFRNDLAKVLDDFIEKYPSHTRRNTIIIDDKWQTFKFNVENAIHIKPFSPITNPLFDNSNHFLNNYSNHSNYSNLFKINKNISNTIIDTELLKIMRYIENKIK